MLHKIMFPIHLIVQSLKAFPISYIFTGFTQRFKWDKDLKIRLSGYNCSDFFWNKRFPYFISISIYIYAPILFQILSPFRQRDLSNRKWSPRNINNKFDCYITFYWSSLAGSHKVWNFKFFSNVASNQLQPLSLVSIWNFHHSAQPVLSALFCIWFCFNDKRRHGLMSEI